MCEELHVTCRKDVVRIISVMTVKGNKVKVRIRNSVDFFIAHVATPPLKIRLRYSYKFPFISVTSFCMHNFFFLPTHCLEYLIPLVSRLLVFLCGFIRCDSRMDVIIALT